MHQQETLVVDRAKAAERDNRYHVGNQKKKKQEMQRKGNRKMETTQAQRQATRTKRSANVIVIGARCPEVERELSETQAMSHAKTGVVPLQPVGSHSTSNFAHSVHMPGTPKSARSPPTPLTPLTPSRSRAGASVAARSLTGVSAGVGLVQHQHPHLRLCRDHSLQIVSMRTNVPPITFGTRWLEPRPFQHPRTQFSTRTARRGAGRPRSMTPTTPKTPLEQFGVEVGVVGVDQAARQALLTAANSTSRWQCKVC